MSELKAFDYEYEYEYWYARSVQVDDAKHMQRESERRMNSRSDAT